MLGQRPIHPAVQRALFRKIDAINRLKVGGEGNTFFNETALEPQDTSNPIEQGIFRACWARVTAGISKPGTKEEDIADKPISFGGYINNERNTQINRPLTFNKNITKDNVASETFRGEAGITGISVSQKSFLINEITINWSCPDPIDFENRIEPTFLRHGQIIAIEFGWGMDDKQLDYEAAELSTEDMENLLNDVYTKQIAKAGSYYCNIGTVSNYTYKSGTDGGYTGTITLHSRGQNVLNQTTKNAETSSDEVPNTITPARAAAENRILAEGEKNKDGTFETPPNLQALEQLNKLKETEASYQSVMRNLDKVLDHYLTVKESAEPVNYRKAAKAGAAIGGTGGVYIGGAAATISIFAPPAGLAVLGTAVVVGAVGAAIGTAFSVTAAAVVDGARRLGAWNANRVLKDETKVNMNGYLEGLRGPKAFYPKPGTIKTWFKNGAMKLIVDDFGLDGGVAGAEVPESLQKKYLLSWGWFEDHILASFFNISITSSKGEQLFQEIRSAQTIGEMNGQLLVSPNTCHISKDLYSLGLDSVILPGKTHPKVNETFDDIDDSTTEGKRKKVLSRIVYTRKNRIELARIRQIYEEIDNRFIPFVPNLLNPEGDIVSSNNGVIRNMVFDLSMYKKHFENMNSLQEGLRSFWSDVSNQYGHFWNFQIVEDKVSTGKIMVVDRDGVTFPDPLEPKSNSKREDFINYSKLLNTDMTDGGQNRNGIFVFPVYSKNSIVKSFDLSVNISSKAATIANYGANTNIVGSVGSNTDKADLGLKAYSLLLRKVKPKNDDNDPKKTKSDNDSDNKPIFREFKFPIDTTKDNPIMSGAGPAPEERYGVDNKGLAPAIQNLDYDGGIDFSQVKDVDEDVEKIREKIEEQRVQFINGIGIYDRYGNFSNYFKSRMKYLINEALEPGTDSNIRERQTIIPIDVDMTIDGISGLLPGDIFKVDYLPKIYREFTYLIIMSVEHTVSTSGWETKIGAKMKLDPKFIKDNYSDGNKPGEEVFTLLTNEEFLLVSAIENIQAEIDDNTKELAKLQNELELRKDESNFSSIDEGIETIVDTFKVWWKVATEFFDDTPGNETLSKGVTNVRDEQKEQRKQQLQEEIAVIESDLEVLEELVNVFTSVSKKDFTTNVESSVSQARTSAAAQDLQNTTTGNKAAGKVGRRTNNPDPTRVQTQADTQYGSYEAGKTAA